jgi:hypothetical protein
MATGTEGTLVEITFRRGSAPKHLAYWKVRAAGVDEGIASGWPTGFPEASSVRFPLFVDAGIPMPLTPAYANSIELGSAANFCGAYIEHAFSEEQQTWIDLGQGGAALSAAIPLASAGAAASPRPIESVARARESSWWFETRFELPFLYQIGAEPGQSEHTLAVFPLFRPEQLQIIRAWINGVELAIQYYAYPRNRKLSCRYADLVGSSAHGGENQLVVFSSFGPR